METFKFILLIENIMGVYRNFSSLGKYRNLVFYRILFEILVQIVVLIYYHKRSESLNIDKIYYTISYIGSLFIICISVYHSKEFSKITKQHADFNNYFTTDEIYKRKLKSRKKVVWYFLLAYNLYTFSTHTAYYLQFSVGNDLESACPDYFLYLIEFTVFLNNFRLIVEIPIISVFYMAIFDQLDAILRSLKTEINCLKKFKATHKFDDTFYSRYNKGVIYDNWSAAYTIVEKKAKLCKNVFGFLITALVVVMIIFYVLLLYGMVNLSITGNSTPLILFMYIFSLSQYIAALLILSRAAQRANNCAKDVRRQLCKLLVLSLGCKKQYKATRDFLRLVRTHPILTHAFGSIDVDMSLPPTCIAFCTSYTVIALQFNNIL